MKTSEIMKLLLVFSSDRSSFTLLLFYYCFKGLSEKLKSGVFVDVLKGRFGSGSYSSSPNHYELVTG